MSNYAEGVFTGGGFGTRLPTSTLVHVLPNSVAHPFYAYYKREPCLLAGEKGVTHLEWPYLSIYVACAIFYTGLYVTIGASR